MLTKLRRMTAKTLAKRQKAKSDAEKVVAGEVKMKIELKAYELFLQRGMDHGRDQEDWLQAEQIILREGAGELVLSA